MIDYILTATARTMCFEFEKVMLLLYIGLIVWEVIVLILILFHTIICLS